MASNPAHPYTTNAQSQLAAGDALGALGLTPAFSPLYQQIKGLILQSLQSGEWKPGESIPSEMDLAARFRVSQGTVRKAIDELSAENLVVRRQGKGTFVATHAEQQVQYRFLKLQPDNGDTQSEGPAERTIIDCKRLRASADIARALLRQNRWLLITGLGLVLAFAAIAWVQWRQVVLLSATVRQEGDNLLWSFYQLEGEFLQLRDRLRDAVAPLPPAARAALAAQSAAVAGARRRGARRPRARAWSRSTRAPT